MRLQPPASARSPCFRLHTTRPIRPKRTLAKDWPTIDFVVHAIGFTNKDALRGKYFDVGLDDFLMTMNISVYSFTAVARRAAARHAAGAAQRPAPGSRPV